MHYLNDVGPPRGGYVNSDGGMLQIAGGCMMLALLCAQGRWGVRRILKLAAVLTLGCCERPRSEMIRVRVLTLMLPF